LWLAGHARAGLLLLPCRRASRHSLVKPVAQPQRRPLFRFRANSFDTLSASSAHGLKRSASGCSLATLQIDRRSFGASGRALALPPGHLAREAEPAAGEDHHGRAAAGDGRPPRPDRDRTFRCNIESATASKSRRLSGFQGRMARRANHSCFWNEYAGPPFRISDSRCNIQSPTITMNARFPLSASSSAMTQPVGGQSDYA